MRARVVERGTGTVVGEIEAASTYDLWLALLAWGEQQGIPRFKVPSLYRSDRHAIDVPGTASVAPATAEPPPPALPEPSSEAEPTPVAPVEVALAQQLTLNPAWASADEVHTPRTEPVTRSRRRARRVQSDKTMQLRFDI